MNSIINRILVLELNNPGDVLMTTPALAGLKEKYPNAIIDFVVDRSSLPVIKYNTDINTVYIYERSNWKTELIKNNVTAYPLELLNFVDNLKTNNYDLLINFYQETTGLILASLISAKEKLGPRLSENNTQEIKDLWTNYLYCIPFARDMNALNITQIFSLVGGLNSTKKSKLILGKDNEVFADNFLLENNLKEKEYITFQGGSAWPTKVPTKKLCTNIVDLLHEQNIKVLVLGAKSELSRIKENFSNCKQSVIFAAGKTTLLQSAALIQKSKHLITPDTVAMHIACALEIPVTALFGPTNPLETGPWSSSSYVVGANVNCLRCFKHSCNTMECMNNLNAENVVANIFKKENSFLESNYPYPQIAIAFTKAFLAYYSKDTSMVLELYKNESVTEYIDTTDNLDILAEYCSSHLSLLDTIIDVREISQAQSIFEKNIDELKFAVPFLVASYRINLNSDNASDINSIIIMYKKNVAELHKKSVFISNYIKQNFIAF